MITIESGEAITDNLLSSKTNAPADDWDIIETPGEDDAKAQVCQLIRNATNNVLSPNF